MQYLEIAFITAALITLPDIDLRLEIAHRKYTHNILFATIVGVLLGFYFKPLGGFHIGFLAGFSAVWIHILGDLFTYMEFAPLWPFIKKKTSLKLFKSSSKRANNTFLILGILTVYYYFLFTLTGTGYELIDALRRLAHDIIEAASKLYRYI